MEEVLPARELPNGGTRRATALPALVEYLRGHPGALVGCDFPFSLPRELNLVGNDWHAFAGSFARRYSGPEDLRDACRRALPGREYRRRCDLEANTPFAPYNLRIFRQTYYGIRDLLAPLAREGCSIVPFDPPARGRTSLFEACPASTLKAANAKTLYRPYKGPGDPFAKQRRRILDWAVKRFDARLPAPDRRTIIENTGGDALDSLLCITCVLRGYLEVSGATARMGRLGRTEPYNGEGIVVF